MNAILANPFICDINVNRLIEYFFVLKDSFFLYLKYDYLIYF